MPHVRPPWGGGCVPHIKLPRHPLLRMIPLLNPNARRLQGRHRLRHRFLRPNVVTRGVVPGHGGIDCYRLLVLLRLKALIRVV